MNLFLTFSDAAKFADVAKNLFQGRGFGSDFTFFSTSVFDQFRNLLFSALGVLPVMPFSIVAFFKIFGINDFAVIATSFFYFLLTLIFIFLLARKVFKSNLVGTLSTLAVGFNYDLIHYAAVGASESPFIFEIVAGAYFLSLKKRWATILAFVFMILLYFTRPQAFVYITGLILYYLLDRLKIKSTLIIFGAAVLLGILVDRFVLAPLNGKDFIYSIISRGQVAVGQNLQGNAVSDSLRGLSTINIPSHFSVYIETFKKVFYNLYNFYKLIPQIMNPYLFTIFTIGLFIKSKSREIASFKIAVLFMMALTLLVTAASIPFFRYIHPVVPLIYIVAVGTLVEIISKFEYLNTKQISNSKTQFLKKHFTVIASTFLILVFGVGQTLGVLLLDSRFERNTHNTGKPPIYVVLSQILKANTNSNQVVITNLDTWGSWYGERKTIWFPLEPKQIIDPTTGKIPFDAIYLTSYLIDDENYYMGTDWRLIFNNPNDPKKWICEGCAEIAKEFQLKGLFKVVAAEDYERQDASAILLIKK
jgi:hypothetical protein